MKGESCKTVQKGEKDDRPRNKEKVDQVQMISTTCKPFAMYPIDIENA